MADDQLPVLVIGAGPVGQTTALLLARRQIPVVVLDARPHRDAIGSKAICQQRDVLDVWDYAGPGMVIAHRGVTWTTSRTFYRDRELFTLEFVDRGRSPFPPWVNISQCETESLLDDAIDEVGLIEVRWGHRVVDIEQADEAVEVTCETPAGSVRVAGRHAVACAGARGELVRSKLGVRFDGVTFDDQFLICDIRADLPGWATERRFYFDPEWNPGRQVLIHACPDSTYRIDWQVPPDFDFDAELSDGSIERRIRQIVGAAPHELLWASVYRFHSRIADRLRRGRVLLAGDVAHLVAPFGARGLNSGVLDAENAAWKIWFVRNGWAGDELLDSYHHERHAAARENLDVTGATMRFLVPNTDEARRHRVAVLRRAADDSAAREQVDSGRFAEPYWYVDSPIVTPDPTRTFAGRPPRGQVPPPAPGVLVPDCPVRLPGEAAAHRLRNVARAGFTALLADGAEVEPVVGLPTGFPLTIYRMRDLSPDGELADILDARPGEIWLLRPDAHVAAVATDTATLSEALLRGAGLPSVQTVTTE